MYDNDFARELGHDIGHGLQPLFFAGHFGEFAVELHAALGGGGLTVGQEEYDSLVGIAHGDAGGGDEERQVKRAGFFGDDFKDFFKDKHAGYFKFNHFIQKVEQAFCGGLLLQHRRDDEQIALFYLIFQIIPACEQDHPFDVTASVPRT